MQFILSALDDVPTIMSVIDIFKSDISNNKKGFWMKWMLKRMQRELGDKFLIKLANTALGLVNNKYNKDIKNKKEKQSDVTNYDNMISEAIDSYFKDSYYTTIALTYGKDEAETFFNNYAKYKKGNFKGGNLLINN